MKKKNLLLLLLMVAFNLCALAQDNEVKKLEEILKGHPQEDTFRVNRLNELAYSSVLSFAERQKLATEALGIARKINYTVGEGYALSSLGAAIFRQGNPTGGLKLFAQADSIARKAGDQDLIAYVLIETGRNKAALADKDGLDLLLKAEAIAQNAGNKKLESRAQGGISSFYQVAVTNYPKALEYALKANRSAGESKSPDVIIRSMIALGGLYSAIGDYDNALKNLEKALEENEKYGSEEIGAFLQNGIGEIYRVTGRYPEAIMAYRQALLVDKTPLGIETNESNLADVYVRMDSLDLAFEYGVRSLFKAREVDDLIGVAWIYGILARAYIKKQMPDSAIHWALAGLDTANITGTIEYMRDNTEVLANAYSMKKDFANAYKYYQQFINYRDSMLNEQVRNKTAVLQYNSDLDKKQAQITTLKEEKKSQQVLLFSTLIGLVLIILTVFMLLRSNRVKQKANLLLHKQKHEIDEKAHELSVQKDNLEKSYNNVELLGEIGRRITSSLSVEKIISTVYDQVNALMDAAVFGIGIYHENLKRIEFPATYEEGKALPFYTNSIDDKNRFAPVCFTSNKEIIIGDIEKEHKHHIEEIVAPHAGGQPVSLIFLPLTIKDKKLGVITVQSFQKNAYSDYQVFMLRNIATYAAIALENAESYETLNTTVVSLRSTQAQLIQSEKMASLGELTAGIAHEIQNPLNFVNNFSEVNKELLAEMNEEIEKKNYDEVKALAKDVTDNEEKIIFHGKRADSIVKGMLQHSRRSNSIKEPTDINVLADEYLRLAYHGLRAKDKSFNATMKTDFDESIGSINIIPQDIGRVILNLITNAFYAAAEKKKQQPEGYEPAITVSTKKIANRVEIKVADNGNGIPKKVLDKIFQPFFTTKPTGEGTGLGLSMSYDIVTKGHGGDLKVDTKEGEGTTFVIILPA